MHCTSSLSFFRKNYHFKKRYSHDADGSHHWAQDGKTGQEQTDDAESTESVHWDAPLDITSYIYKPEFVLMSNKSKGRLHHRVAGKSSETTLVTDNSSYTTVSAAPPLPLCPNDNEEEAKKQFVEDYVRSMNKRRSLKAKSMHAQRIQDYTRFVKDVNNEVRNLNFETKRWESYTPLTPGTNNQW